jgi:hypothetical protein
MMRKMQELEWLNNVELQVEGTQLAQVVVEHVLTVTNSLKIYKFKLQIQMSTKWAVDSFKTKQHSVNIRH